MKNTLNIKKLGIAALVASCLMAGGAMASVITLVYDDIESGGGITLAGSPNGWLHTSDAVAVGSRAAWVQNSTAKHFYGVGANSIYSQGSGAGTGLAFGTLVDVSSVGSEYNKLNLSFGYYAEAADKVSVHLWGLKATGGGASNVIALWNEGWVTDYTGTAYDAFDLGASPDGAKDNNKNSSAVAQLAGSGTDQFYAQNFSFDLGTFNSGLNNLGEYDYVMLAFHKTLSADGATWRVNDILLTADLAVPEPSTLALLGCGLALMAASRRRMVRK